MQDPDATRVAGYQTWKQMGRQVKRGAKGLMILAPMRPRLPVPEDEETPRTPPVRTFKPVYVFDVRQTEGENLPQLPSVQGDPGPFYKRLEGYVMRELGVRVDFVLSLGGALGRSMNGRIELLRDISPAQRFSTLAHEAAHEALHWSVPEEVRKDKTLVEKQAEAVAFVLCQAVGLDCNSAAADYIGLYRGNKETLRLSLAAIHAASAPMLRAVLPPEAALSPETVPEAVPERGAPPAPQPKIRTTPTRGARKGSPLSLCRDLPAAPRLGAFVLVRDLPETAQFITREDEVRELNVLYARRSGAYDSFFIVAGAGGIAAVYGMHGIVPWLDRETVLLYRVRR